MQKDKELQMLQNTNDSDANIPKNKEDANSYDWGKHPNSLKALKRINTQKVLVGILMVESLSMMHFQKN